MAAAGKSLIDHDETDLQHTGNGEEQHVENEDLKDTKYSWFVCSCTFLAQVFILGVLHAYGVFFVEFVKEFKSPKAKAGKCELGQLGAIATKLVGVCCSVQWILQLCVHNSMLLFFQVAKPEVRRVRLIYSTTPSFEHWS